MIDVSHNGLFIPYLVAGKGRNIQNMYRTHTTALNKHKISSNEPTNDYTNELRTKRNERHKLINISEGQDSYRTVIHAKHSMKQQCKSPNLFKEILSNMSKEIQRKLNNGQKENGIFRLNL